MSTRAVKMNNNISFINDEKSPFMQEYYNSRMKMWNPYADIPIINDNNIQNNLDILIKAIEFVETQNTH